MQDTTDVLIVGAGPVGLLLATELSRDGVDVVLIDRMRERRFFCKALGVTQRTLEIFDDLGIAHDAIDRGVWLRGLSSFDGGVPGASMDMAQGLPFGNLSLAQFETEGLLERTLQRHGGRVHYGWELLGFEAGEDGVRAQLQGSQGSQAPHGQDGAARNITCRWLVGCDGAHSKVRSTLGLSFEGASFPQTFALADLEVEWDLPRGRAYRFNHRRDGDGTTLVAIPVNGSSRRYRLSMVLPDAAVEGAAGPPQSPDLGQVSAWMLPLLPSGARLSSLHWSSVYRISHRIVSAYSRGRVFLAGDAAHLHPPIGGQGMNTGLQDAHNLAWKLALASRNQDAPGLLDSYSAERHPVGLDVVESTSLAMNEALAQQAKLPGIRETQLLVGYRDSSLVRDERTDAADAELAAGDRAPDAGGLRRAFVEQPFRLHERVGRGRHVLVGYVDGSAATVDSMAELWQVLQVTLDAAASGFVIAPAAATVTEREDLRTLVDGSGEFAAAFAARHGMAWLIRPDGHIGWCSATPSVAGLRAYLKAVARAPAPEATG